MNKLIDFVKQEFELNQRQARIFLVLSVILVILIGVELYPFGSDSEPINYTISYIDSPRENEGGEKQLVALSTSESSERNASKYVQAKTKELGYLGDLNLIGVDSLKLVRGIGEVLSERIIKFRDALGGFYAKDQLYEVYGLDSVVAQRLISLVGIETKWNELDINTANFKEINKHPYISYNHTKQIVNLRREKIFLTKTDIKSILGSDYNKVSVYLAY